MQMTSVVIGVVFFVTKKPHYLSQCLYAFFEERSIILSGFGFVLYPVPSIVAPDAIMFSSPIHKKLLKETYQSIASRIAGTSVKERFLFSAEDEEML